MKIRLSWLAVFLAIALIAAGCGGGGTTSVTTTTTTPATTTTTAAGTTTTTTATTTTTLGGTVPVEKVTSLFGVDLGWGTASVEAVIGSGTIGFSAIPLTNIYSYTSGTKTVGYDVSGGGRGAVVMYTTDPTYEVSGISVGSTSTAVESAFGIAQKVSTSGTIYWWSYVSRNLRFKFTSPGHTVEVLYVYDSDFIDIWNP